MRNGAFANDDEGNMVQDWFDQPLATDVTTVPLEETASNQVTGLPTALPLGP